MREGRSRAVTHWPGIADHIIIFCSQFPRNGFSETSLWYGLKLRKANLLGIYGERPSPPVKGTADGLFHDVIALGCAQLGICEGCVQGCPSLCTRRTLGHKRAQKRGILKSETLHSGTEFRNFETAYRMGASASEYSSSWRFRFVGIRTDAAFDESIENLRSGRVRSGRSCLHPHGQ
jgi:hypothetical protein